MARYRERLGSGSRRSFEVEEEGILRQCSDYSRLTLSKGGRYACRISGVSRTGMVSMSNRWGVLFCCLSSLHLDPYLLRLKL